MYLENSLEDYLAEIYRLEEAYGYARVGRLAKELSVSPATVSKMIRKLEKMGLVKKTVEKKIKLTEKGKEAARKLIDKHLVVEQVLMEVLGIDYADAHAIAHYLEHIPDSLLEKIKAKVPEASHRSAIEGTKLSDVGENSACKVVAFNDLKSLFKFLSKHGISKGSRLFVKSKTAYYLEVFHENRSLRIPLDIARLIRVEVVR